MRDRSTGVKPESGGDAPSTVLFDVWLVARSAQSVIDETLLDSGLNAEEFAIYSILTRGPMTPTDLSRWMAAPPTTVSSYVKRFEKRGHVRRRPNADDGRSYRIALTAAGKRAWERAGGLFLPLLDSVHAELGMPTEAVAGTLLELRRALDAARARKESSSAT